MERKRSVIYSLWNLKRLGEQRGEELQFAIKPIFLLRCLLRFLLSHKVMAFSCHWHLWKVFHNCTYHCMLWFPTFMYSFAILLSVLMVKYRHLSFCWKYWLRNIKMNECMLKLTTNNGVVLKHSFAPASWIRDIHLYQRHMFFSRDLFFHGPVLP